MFGFLRYKLFLKKTSYYFLIGVAIFIGGCAAYQGQIQEEYGEEPLESEDPLSDTADLATDSVLATPNTKPLTEVVNPPPPAPPVVITPLTAPTESMPPLSVFPSDTVSAVSDAMIDSPAYVLGPEDVVQVLVWKDETLTRTIMVRPDGKIALPLVGEVQAGGLTPAELANGVKKSLQKYYKELPEVSVIVTEINSVAIFVLGEVAIPGKHILRRETTFLQALSLAGGFKEYADTGNILLLRREGNIETRIRINYKDLVNGKSPDDNLPLKAGDTIIVP